LLQDHGERGEQGAPQDLHQGLHVLDGVHVHPCAVKSVSSE
jgi:hypothetical protein